MFPSNSANTTFITPTWMYCYNVMPFGVKNVRSTYQRMMSCIFEPLSGNSMEAYINDMLIKSKSREDHFAHLQKVFQLMRLHHLRPNANKFSFGVESGNFIGLLVSRRRIEMAPDQSKAIMQMPSPETKNKSKLS